MSDEDLRPDTREVTADQTPPQEQQRWQARPVLAGTLRAVLLAVPLVASTGATYLLARLLPEGSGRTWWGLSALLITAVVVAIAVERGARRLLPIALLLKLSMIFPDRAPSRLKLARTAAVRTPTNELVWNGDAAEPTSTADLVLNLVSALGTHDRRTRGHSERVRLLCDMLAEELKLDTDARDRLRWSALLHDVGKMQVSTSILNKPGRLDAREFDRIKQHPALGAELAAPLLPWLGEWGDGILDHHEKYDGTGYPNGKSGCDISQAGRLIGLIDAFETMTAARAYKKAMATKAAREELARCSGTHFDPIFVRAFLAISLPRVLWAMGPFSFLFQLPFIRPLAEAGVRTTAVAPQAAAAAMASGAAGAAVLVTGGMAVGGPALAVADVGDGGRPAAIAQSAPQWLHDQLGSAGDSDEVAAGAAADVEAPVDEQDQAAQESAPQPVAAIADPPATDDPEVDDAIVDGPVQQPRSESPVTDPAPQEQPPVEQPAGEVPPVSGEPTAEEPAVQVPATEPETEQPVVQEPVAEPVPAQTRAEEEWADTQPNAPAPAPDPLVEVPTESAPASPTPPAEVEAPVASPFPAASSEPEPTAVVSPTTSAVADPEPTATASPSTSSGPSAGPTTDAEPTAGASPGATPTPTATATAESSPTPAVVLPPAQVTIAGTGPAIASGPASPSTSRTATFTLKAVEGVQWQCQVLGNATGMSSAPQICPSGEYVVTVVGDGPVTLNVSGGSLSDSWSWTVQTVTLSPRGLSDVLLLDELSEPGVPDSRNDGLTLMALLMGVAVPIAAAARRVRSRSS